MNKKALIMAGLAGLGALGAGMLLARKPTFILGAWTGQAAFVDPHKVGRRAKELGLHCLDVIVGDQSKGATVSGGLPWEPYASMERVKEVIRILKTYVPFVWVTAWAQPRQDVIDGIATLARAAKEARASGITLDAEEAWVQPLRRTGQTEEWSQWIAVAAKSSGLPLATTTIVYHDRGALDPLLTRSDVLIPQAYATLKNAGNMAPGQLERIAVERFKPYGKPLIMGAASWNQAGAYGGLSVRQATAASVRTALELNIHELRFWQLSTFDNEDLAGIRDGMTGATT